MSSCKDCVHCEVCQTRDGQTEFYGLDIDCNNVEELCEHFKPKSRFVELPCEVGQTVYFIGRFTEQIVPSKVISIGYNEGGFYLICENFVTVSVTEQLGKTVFLDPAKAEKALKERENV